MVALRRSSEGYSFIYLLRTFGREYEFLAELIDRRRADPQSRCLLNPSACHDCCGRGDEDWVEHEIVQPYRDVRSVIVPALGVNYGRCPPLPSNTAVHHVIRVVYVGTRAGVRSVRM